MICGRLEVVGGFSVVGFADVVSADDDDGDDCVLVDFLAAFSEEESEEVAEEDESDDDGDDSEAGVTLKSETSFWASVALVRLRNEKSDILWSK